MIQTSSPADLAASIERDDPEERVMTTGVRWQAYEALLAQLEDNNHYRISYLDGTLEIVSPSRAHEGVKKRIATLLEAYLIETDTRFYPLGSTTFRNQEKRGGKEPDESYCIGAEKELPDLAIEVIASSGGIDSLEVYQRLGVREVWFWQDNRFSIYHLQENGYQPGDRSELLPDLNLNLVAEHVGMPDAFDALKQFRQQLQQT